MVQLVGSDLRVGRWVRRLWDGDFTASGGCPCGQAGGRLEGLLGGGARRRGFWDRSRPPAGQAALGPSGGPGTVSGGLKAV